MVIFITIPSMNLAGGIERVVAVQANYWAEKKGFQVYIITYVNEEDSFYYLSHRVHIVHLRIDKKVISKRSNPYVKRKLIRSYKESFVPVLNMYNPDIVFTMMHGIDTFLLKKICREIPVVAVNHVSLTMRRGDYLSGKAKLLNYFRYKILVRTLKKFDAVVALARKDECMLKELGCKVVYIPNPVSINPVKEYGEKKKWIVCTGRLDYLKGQDRLLDIWKDVFMLYPDWKLLFMGEGKDKSKLEKWVEKNCISDAVDFLGNRKDVTDILSQAGIFASTSRTESFGMAIAEALAAGLPVICYDCETGPRDIVHSFYNGFLVRENDKTDFRKKLILLIQDNDLRKKLGDFASESMHRFDVDVVMPMYDDLIDSLCKK